LESIGERRLHLVLKTLPYDPDTFCTDVTPVESAKIVQDLVKVCAYFYYYDLWLYTDWKPENIIWAGEKMMLVDIVLMKPGTEKPIIDKYYYCRSRNNESVKQMYLYGCDTDFYSSIVVDQMENPTWPIAGMYNTFQMFVRQHTRPPPIIFGEEIENAIKRLIENTKKDSKTAVGKKLLEVASQMDRSGLTGGADPSRSDARSSLLMALSGLGIVVMASLAGR
jgi:hypothetical protein